MAAIQGHCHGKNTLILERMNRPALKLRMSGKGRCNITNAAPVDEFITHFGKNGRFLKYAFRTFFSTDLLRYFEQLGVSFKLERGGRYFPQNDNAMDIVEALLKQIKAQNINLTTGATITRIRRANDCLFNLSIDSGGKSLRMTTEKIVLATGGKSYPGTGSDGSGYALAQQLGHTVTPVYPALVPLTTADTTAQKLQGLSLKNVQVSVYRDGKKTSHKFGEMLFTDSGVSGPVILSLSSSIVSMLQDGANVHLYLDLKPALDLKMLDSRLLREINARGKKSFKSLLKELLPKKLIPVFLDHLKIQPDKQISHITAEERKKLKIILKNFPLKICGHKSYDEAIVTRGGISLSEINPQTMESKIVKNLYFAGEVIDIDADTGGYNLQAAFSTGWLAGRSCRGAVGSSQ